jgi:hypothetical protein
MILRRYIFITLLSALSFAVLAKDPDSVKVKMAFSVQYGYHLPGGDLEKRFGENSSVGGKLFFSHKSGFFWGAEGNFLFGGQVLENGILDSLKGNDGYIIDGNGMYAEIYLYERGFDMAVLAGWVIPLVKSQPKSGLVLSASCGLLQHKIRIENKDNTAPQIKGDYKKGYDRLTNGLCLKEYIGYQYMSNHRLLNFTMGLEFTQAWTQNRREYNFDTRTKDISKRLDLLSGIRVGWIIPMNKRKPQPFYYN